MSRKLCCLIIGVSATAIGALGASTSQASRGISVSPLANYSANGIFTLNSQASCNFLIGFSLNDSVVEKITGTLQATVLHGTIRNCAPLFTSGTFLAPILVRYRSFIGTLPNITGIGIFFPSLGLELSGPVLQCLYSGAFDGMTLGIASRRVTTVNVNNSTALPFFSGSSPLLCWSHLTFRGVLNFLNAPTVALT